MHWENKKIHATHFNLIFAYCGDLKLNPQYLQSMQYACTQGFPGGSDGKESACNTGDAGLIPGSGRSSTEGPSNPLQYSCLGNPKERGAWQAIVHGSQKARHDLATKQQQCLFHLPKSLKSHKCGKQKCFECLLCPRHCFLDFFIFFQLTRPYLAPISFSLQHRFCS